MPFIRKFGQKRFDLVAVNEGVYVKATRSRWLNICCFHVSAWSWLVSLKNSSSLLFHRKKVSSAYAIQSLNLVFCRQVFEPISQRFDEKKRFLLLTMFVRRLAGAYRGVRTLIRGVSENIRRLGKLHNVNTLFNSNNFIRSQKRGWHERMKLRALWMMGSKRTVATQLGEKQMSLVIIRCGWIFYTYFKLKNYFGLWT